MATKLNNNMPIILRTKPALTICGIVKAPDANTIALGGVATGSINAQLAAKVIGMHNNSGETSSSSATAAITGRKVAAVATLEVSSVKNITNVVAPTTSTKIPRPPSGVSELPNHSAKPEPETVPKPKARRPPQLNIWECSTYSY